jgi:RsiW-degrading membrane proteinase PrsW (M82 family)
MAAMVIMMFLLGVLIFLFAGRLAEVFMARARVRGPEKGPMTAKHRFCKPCGR